MTPYNEHIRLAQAMLHGHLYIDPAPPWMEHIVVNGHSYILHPPLSAILCLPFVAMGIVDQRLICIMLGIVSTILCYRLTRSAALTTFFVFGTTFLYECTNGASWNFALVASTPFTFAALKAVDDDNNVLVGLFAGFAALARYDLVLALPVYLWVIWRKHNEASTTATMARMEFSGHTSARNFVGYCVPLLFVFLIYIWFNEARFGTLTDGSVQEWYWHYDAFRAQRPYGPFSLHYLPFNLYTLLFMAPAFQGGFPWVRPTFMGQALLSLSPAFLLADLCPWLLAALLCSIPALTVYASGFSQLGCRYYVQVFPFLIAAMAQKPMTNNGKTLIVLSIMSSMTATIIVWIWGLA